MYLWRDSDVFKNGWPYFQGRICQFFRMAEMWILQFCLQRAAKSHIWSPGHVYMETDQIYVFRSLWPRYFEVKGYLELHLQINITQAWFRLQLWYGGIKLKICGEFYLLKIWPWTKVKGQGHTYLTFACECNNSEIWGLESPNFPKKGLLRGSDGFNNGCPWLIFNVIFEGEFGNYVYKRAAKV